MAEERDMTDDEIWAAKATGYWLKGMSWIATLGGVIPGAGFVLSKASEESFREAKRGKTTSREINDWPSSF
jgi:hypothetical protein